MHTSKRLTYLVASSVVAAIFLMLAATITDDSIADAKNPPSTLLGTVSVDPSQSPNTTDPSPVWAILEANGRYYVGGEFTEVGGESQSYVAAIEVATGQLDPTFRPVVTGGTTEVLTIALSPDDNDLYIGGIFTSINGVIRNRIAKIDAHTGAVDSTFNPNASAVVETIAVDDQGVYVGGKFNTIGGIVSPNLVKLNTTTGAADPSWSASTNGSVLDIEVVGDNVYVGGNFTQVSGAPHERLVRLRRADGSVHNSWNVTASPPDKVQVLSLSQDRNTLYVGTAGSLRNNGNGNAIWAYSKFGDRVWHKSIGGDVQALEASATTLYVGTHADVVFTEPKFELDGVTPNPNFPANGYVEDPNTNPNAIRRKKLFSLNLTNGDLLSFDPELNSINGVWELERGPSGLLVGGDFTEVAYPTGATGVGPTLFTSHVAIFPNIEASNDAPEPLFSFGCTGTICTFDAAASSDENSIATYTWDFGNGQTTNGVAATATLANNTTHEVTLTVTDNTGTSASRTQLIPVGNAGTAITPIETASANSSSNQLTVQLPNTAQTGDVAVAFVTVNTASTVPTAPAGWTQVGDETNSNLRTYVFWRQLASEDASTNATFSLSTSVMSDLTVSTFRGVDNVNPIASIDFASTSEIRADHTAPALNFTGDATLLQFWAERTSASTEVFATPDLATLSTSIGTGSARVNTVLALDPITRTATSPPSVAVTEHHGDHVLGWSIALRAGTVPPSTCNGLQVTVDLAMGQTPTVGDDVILGTAGNDVIAGLSGNDTICGGDGNDTINGGPGNDLILGESGTDNLFGLDGNDTIYGGNGDDLIVGAADDDQLFGEGGADTLNGGSGDDTLSGGDGEDDLFGQAGVDTISGGNGADFATGATGNDTINGDAGNDIINGGPDEDTLSGGADDDTIFGLTGNDIMNGDAGNDMLFGQFGFDVIDGGAGNDQLLGNEDNDIITDPSGTNILNGGAGNDQLTGGSGTDNIFGDGNLGQAGNDTLSGNGGSDLLVGFSGQDTINSQDGGTTDTVNGGPDTDSCTTDAVDTVFNCP